MASKAEAGGVPEGALRELIAKWRANASASVGAHNFSKSLVWLQCAGQLGEALASPPPAPPPMDGVWRCECCGEMVNPISPDWRWAGTHWQHQHEYPAGHMPARYFGAAPPAGEALDTPLTQIFHGRGGRLSTAVAPLGAGEAHTNQASAEYNMDRLLASAESDIRAEVHPYQAADGSIEINGTVSGYGKQSIGAGRWTVVTYRCDHCGYENHVRAESHGPRGCNRTNCNGTQHPVEVE